jgi:hypothetical protein
MGYPPGSLLSVYAFAHSHSLVIDSLRCIVDRRTGQRPLSNAIRFFGPRSHSNNSALRVVPLNVPNALQNFRQLSLRLRLSLKSRQPARQTDILCESGESHS